MKIHPAAEMFPLMHGADFDALVADIKEHGQREPIIVHEGAILDGRNRHRACQEIGIEPELLDWNGADTPEEFVVSMNLHRRHLNESQRAMIAARLAPRKRGDVCTQTLAAKEKNSGAGIPAPVLSIPAAAQMLKVNKSTVSAAKAVLRDGTRDEIRAVESGEISLHKVASQIRRKVPAAKRAAHRDLSQSMRGRNPERIQNQQLEAEVWAKVQTALDALTGIPLPAEVAAIIRKNVNRARVVDQRVLQALNWLEEFANEWTRSRQDAA